MKFSRNVGLVIAASAATLSLVACGQAQVDGVRTTPAAVAESSSEVSVGQNPAQGDDELWESVLLDFPNASKPDTRVVREVTPDTWPTAFAECLGQRGFGASVDGGGVAVEEPPSGQEEAFAIARYACLVEYPLESKYTDPLSEAQILTLYRYQSTELVSCLEGEGYSIGEPPTEAVYVAAYQSGDAPWSPYLDLPPMANADFESLNERCPQIPTGFYTN